MKTKGGGAAKGASFEREVCVRFSLWITGGKKRDCLWRSAMSGGRATAAFRRNGTRLDNQAGDICAISPEGLALTNRFYFECKFRRSIGLEKFILFNTGPLAVWWKKTFAEARRHGRDPVLIAKSNGVPPIIITERNDREPLSLHYIATVRGLRIGLLARVLAHPYTGP